MTGIFFARIYSFEWKIFRKSANALQKSCQNILGKFAAKNYNVYNK